MAQAAPGPILVAMSAHRIVIAGGGVAALEAALALHTLGGSEVQLVLVSPRTEFSYRAHQVIEPFGASPGLTLPLSEILAETDIAGVHDGVVGVDTDARRVQTSSGRSLDYDGLLVAVGGTPFPAYAHGVTFDRPGDPAPFEELLFDIGPGLVSDVAFVVPDEGGWTLPAYDIALILRAWARRRGLSTRIRLLSAERAPLELFGAPASETVGEVLTKAEIEFAGGSEPVVISDTMVMTNGHWHTTDRIVSLPRLAGPRLPGLPCDWAGFIEVDERGAVPGCPGVYAAGDGAAHPRKQGGLAAQQADLAARELLAEAGISVPAPPERPMLRGVLATPDGPLFLQARTGYGEGDEESVASFRPLWSPPSKVVTRWLGDHLDGLVSRRTSAFAASAIR